MRARVCVGERCSLLAFAHEMTENLSFSAPPPPGDTAANPSMKSPSGAKNCQPHKKVKRGGGGGGFVLGRFYFLFPQLCREATTWAPPPAQPSNLVEEETPAVTQGFTESAAAAPSLLLTVPL